MNKVMLNQHYEQITDTSPQSNTRGAYEDILKFFKSVQSSYPLTNILIFEKFTNSEKFFHCSYAKKFL